MNNQQSTRQATEKNAEQRGNNLLDSVKDKFADIVEEAKGRSGEWVEKARDQGSDLLEEAQDRGEDAVKSVTMWVRRNPGTALGIAVVAGAVLFALYSRDDA